jgi:hypothetical protein
MIRSLTFPKLPKFLTFKGLPEPFNQLMRPLVLVSIGLHAALLLTPIPSPPVKPKPAQPKTVKITTLPPLKSKRLVTNKFPGKALLKPRLFPVVHKGLVIHRSTKKPIVKVAQAPSQKTPRPQNTPQTVPSTQPVPTGGASSDTSNPMSDFPHYPGESEGCLNVSGCFETHKPIDVVSKYFQEQLPLKNFTVTSITNNEADRKVYQISKGGAQQFLNILVPDGKTAVYVLAEKAMTVGDLQNAVQIPPDFTENIMASLPDGTAVESADPFATPTDFFSNPGGVETDGPNKGMDISPVQNTEIDSMKLVSSQTPQQLFSGFLTPQLTQSGYQPPKSVATYGGGQLYELKKGTSKPFYLNLVPAKDGKGTIVVVWRSKPA